MSTYEESYSNTTTDLEYFVPDIQAFDRKIVITNWQTYASNIYLAGSTGTMDEVFRDNVYLTIPETFQEVPNDLIINGFNYSNYNGEPQYSVIDDGKILLKKDVL